jgi:hypothetical protein
LELDKISNAIDLSSRMNDLLMDLSEEQGSIIKIHEDKIKSKKKEYQKDYEKKKEDYENLKYRIKEVKELIIESESIENGEVKERLKDKIKEKNLGLGHIRRYNTRYWKELEQEINKKEKLLEDEWLQMNIEKKKFEHQMNTEKNEIKKEGKYLI